MTRTERALREAARFMLEQGWSRDNLLLLYESSAAHAEADGKHDEAAEIRAAVSEFRTHTGKENGNA